MSISLSDDGPAAADVGPEILDACAFVRAQLGIGDGEVEATFLFGSHARGAGRAGSDVDLIFVINERSDHPEFRYCRLHRGLGKIDANLVKPSFLNELCRVDVGWSYRLHNVLPIKELTRIPGALLSRWTEKIDNFVEGSVACRARLLRHVRECRLLLRSAKRVNGVEPAIATYLMIEVLFLLPIIFLNYGRIVPFQNDIPWNEALRNAAGGSDLSQQYKELLSLIAQSRLFRWLDDKSSFAYELKEIRDKCRSAISRHSTNIFRDRYGTILGELLKRDSKTRGEILRLMAAEPENYCPLVDAIFVWLKHATKRQSRSEFPPGIKTAVRRKRDRSVETRYVHYDQFTSRLKAIVPTGGCRVPTCTFCMLPSLAHSKSAVEESVARIVAECAQRPVRQLTIYTDGSFFDDKELNRDERLLIAGAARELRAEELLVESLPRFLNADVVDDVIVALGPKCRLRLGVGLQSSDALVRRYVTRTPITQAELRALLAWRKVAPFALRLYLLANKPMLSATEDSRDLRRSLQFLNEWLTDADTVTINPLLPTNATVLARVWGAGCWRPLRIDEARALEADVRSGNYAFRIEFGPAVASTCSEIDLRVHEVGAAAEAAQQFALTDPAFLPWSLLGGLRHRSRWVTRGGVQHR